MGTLAEVDDAQLRMRNSLKMGLYINVAGMLLALIGAEQIVGTLVAKVLYSQGEDERKTQTRARVGKGAEPSESCWVELIRRQVVCCLCVVAAFVDRVRK